MKTDSKANLLDDLIIVSTFEKVVNSKIKKQVFFWEWHFCHPVGTLRVEAASLVILWFKTKYSPSVLGTVKK